jgi:putative transposase
MIVLKGIRFNKSQLQHLGSEPGSDPDFYIDWGDSPLDVARSCSKNSGMPRPARICVPGIPLHIVQRGHNRQKCFRKRSDYLRYLGFLAESAKQYEAQVHAYVLMTNHVHLLVTPCQDYSASRMMQHLGRRYVQAFNRVYERTGTLWEGRFRSFPVSTEGYLFACYRYIELNPVRAGITESPDEYPWSSYRTNALGAPNAVVQPREEWLDLGQTATERCEHYQQLFNTALDEGMIAEIRASIRSGSEPGSDPG